MRTTKGSLGKALLGRQAIKKTNGGECAEAWAGRAVGVEPSKKSACSIYSCGTTPYR